MKNLITAALIAMVATSAQARMDPANQKAAISCAYEYYDRRPEVELTDLGKKLIELAAQGYDLSNDLVVLGDDEEAEQLRQKFRDQVKEYFGKHAGEINYCFRQHMGE